MMEPLTLIVIALTVVTAVTVSYACWEVRKASRRERAFVELLCAESALHVKLLKETLNRIEKEEGGQ